MRRLARHDVAPWIHTLTFGVIAAAAFTLLTGPRWTWLLAHPEALAGLVAAMSRLTGALVKRVPHLQTPDTRAATSTQLVHSRIASVIDTLAYVQAELDTMADAVHKTRARTQTLDGEN